MAAHALVNKIKENLLYHIVDSTAMLSESTPFFAAFETQVAGMTNEVSLKTRFSAATLTFLGLGWGYIQGRKYWRKGFGITGESSEGKQALHDILYTTSFNALISPLLYWLGGETDLEKILVGTTCAMGFGAVNGGPMGYTVDSMEDLTGLKECKRTSYPPFLKNMNSKAKKGLTLLLVAATLGLTAWIYSVNPVYEKSP